MKATTLLLTASMALAANMRAEQQWKVCKTDADCNPGFWCRPTNDNTFAMCQPGSRPTTPSPSLVSWLQLNGQDFTGQDLSNVPNVANINDCKQHCDKTQGCQSISYAHNTCYLKSKPVNYSLNNNVNSLMKVAPHFKCYAHSDFEKHDLVNFQADYDGCAAACSSRGDCNAFVWTKSSWSTSGICYLKTIDENQGPIANSIGAVACAKTN